MMKRFVFIPALLIYGLLVALQASIHSPTRDEPVHLAAGLHILRHGGFDKNRGNPPLANAVAAFPVRCFHSNYVPNLRDDRWLLRSPESPSICWTFALARFGCIPFGLLGGYVCYRWSSELYGRPGGLLSLSLWCFSPSILSFSQLITADMAATATGVTAAYMLWRWWSRPSWRDAAIAGAALGIMLLSKMVWVVSLVLWPTAWFVAHVARGYRATRSTSWVSEVSQLTAILIVGVVVLNCGYLFERTMRPLNQYSKFVRQFGGFDPPEGLAAVPVAIPENYIRGISEIQDVVSRSHRSYLSGEWRETGWWYYYLYALGVKTPVGTIGLFTIAIALFLGRIGNNCAGEVFVMLPAVGFLEFVSYFSTISHHFRYALPFLPFCFVFAGRTAWCFTHCSLFIRRVVVVCWVATLCASLWNWPHSLSYFNVVAGGSQGGRHHLIDSSLDWGQDLLFLKRWIARHPEAEPLNLVYFGSVDPRLIGIKYQLPAGGDDDLAPGWYAVSVNFVMGRESEAPDGQGGLVFVGREDYAFFQKFKPVARAGYSIDIYHLEEGLREDELQLERGP